MELKAKGVELYFIEQNLHTRDLTNTILLKLIQLLTPEQFYKCKAILQSSKNYIDNVGKYKGVSKYSKLIYCGHCGKVYYSNTDRGNRFYCCSTKKQYGITNCSSRNISEKVLDKKVKDLINGGYKRLVELTCRNLLYSFYTSLIELRETFGMQDKTEIERIKSEIKIAEDRREKLLGLYVSNHDDSDEMLKRKINEEKVNISRLEAELERKLNPVRSMKDDLELLTTSIQEVRKLMARPAPSTEADMINCIDRITIIEGVPDYSLKRLDVITKCAERFGDKVFMNGKRKLSESEIDAEIELTKRTLLENVP